MQPNNKKFTTSLVNPWYKKKVYEFIAKKQTNCSIVIQKVKLLHFQLDIHLEIFFLNIINMAGSYLILKKI